MRAPWPFHNVVHEEHRTVLVAEDEPLVRLAVVEALTDAGFAVIEAEHAAEALSALNSSLGRIVLLFTDINMPGSMNGLDLAHHVHSSWPHIAILIASGRFPPSPAARPREARFIAKPYNPADVVADIRRMVTNAGVGASRLRRSVFITGTVGME
jgi:DNA-binding NtrC family response regulator